ncbi:MAG: glycoside hydrolase family 95 protein [Lentisphaeria bacterium]|nr:glycoside hydrolase family 95 protein [Lentisphaeria bacterium]
MAVTGLTVAQGDEAVMDIPKVYELWENEPAPNRGADYQQIKARGYPYDKDWEYHAYPLGNGYIGACLFGRTDTERVQITDKTLHVEGPYAKRGGLSNFAELYLDFGHEDVNDYRRALNLNTAMATVSYESGGVRYDREYFVSYPDRVVVIRLAADKAGALSFKVRPRIPYVNAKQPGDRRTATTVVGGDLITLSGTTAFFSCNYEAQVKVLHEGGTLSHDQESITVSEADSVTIILATGTNYRLGPHIFLNEPTEKLDPDLYPHEEVSDIVRRAVEKGYAALKADHLADYQHLFNRVAVNLNARPSALPTSKLLAEYNQGKRDTWLEELMFQYGRYLLIASSREKSLPANLQGTWSQYEVTPWSGGYWHNINVQMNYWGAMSANLAETFEAYLAYFNAYLPKAREYARSMVRKRDPDLADRNEDNGWIVGTGASAYHIGGPGGHSGPGTGGFTSKLLMDYTLFTGDRAFLEAVAYPAMLSLSRFYSSTLVPHGDLLLVEPSASPENKAKEAQLKGMPGKMTESGHYVTAGCAFDQGFVWENFNDTLILARLLGKQDPFLKTIEEQMGKLDPILIGSSGQIKEYREENAYSDIGDPKHRHISHLCPLYPGTLINSSRPEWMRAAMKTLDLRGDRTTGWAIAHRMNCRARLKQGDKAHDLYARLLAEKTTPNLWTLHPPFQIDANLGAMAGVVEMLLQSHEEYIELLPALPKAWQNGRFEGLVARGNFVVDAEWIDGRATRVTVTSRDGGECRLACPGIENAGITDQTGNPVPARKEATDRITFATVKGKRYHLVFQEQE